MPQPKPVPHCVAVWLDLMRTTDALLLAGLRHKIGPDGDLRAAYREWYEQHMREHGRAIEMSRVPSSLRAWAINALWAINCSASCFASDPYWRGDERCGGYGLIIDLAVPSLRRCLFPEEEAAPATTDPIKAA